MTPPPLSVSLRVPKAHEARAKYAWSVLCQTAGIPYRFAGPDEDSLDVSYGQPDAAHSAAVRLAGADWDRVVNVPPRIRATCTGPGELFWAQSAAGGGGPAFDPIAAAYWLIRGWELQAGVARDEHGRPVGRRSPLAELGILHEPMVDHYARRLLADLGEAGIPIVPEPHWPEGRRFALVMTHDLDQPVRWTRHGLRGLVSRAVKKPGPASWWALLAGLAEWAATRGMGMKDPYECLEQWAHFEASIGTKSAVYVASVARDQPRGTPCDVGYHFASNRIARALRKLDQAGWEIGLHASYDAWRDPAFFRQQAMRLEELLGHQVDGLRHHVLRLDAEDPERTLAIQEAVGFRCDTSVIFNDCCGFRRGIASPYHPPGPDDWPALSLVELGHSLMDNQELRGVSAGQAEKAFQDVINRIVEVGGCVVLNWHVRTWHEKDFPGWRATCQGLARKLADRDDVWLALPGQVAAWWRERAGRLRRPPHEEA